MFLRGTHVIAFFVFNVKRVDVDGCIRCRCAPLKT